MYVRMRGMEGFGTQRNVGKPFIFRHDRIANNSHARFFWYQQQKHFTLSDFAIVVFSFRTRFEFAAPLHSCVSIYLDATGSQSMMDIEEGTDLQRTAIEQQDQGEGEESGKKGEYAENLIPKKKEPTEQQNTQSVPGFRKAGGAWGDNHSKTNLGPIPPRVNANAQPFLGQTRSTATVTSGLQAFPIIRSRNYSSPSDLSTNQGLSENKAKAVSKGEELQAANARFEILQEHCSSLREELEECYLRGPVGVCEDVRERLEDIAAAIRSNQLGPEVPNRNCSVTVGNPSEVRPTKSVSFTNIPQWREYFPTETSPVIAGKKAKLSVFSKLAGYTSFFQFFKRGECSAQSSLQSAGSNTKTTSATNSQEPPFEKSDNAHNQQASEDNGGTIALRELANKTLHQNNLILSKLGYRRNPVMSRPTSFRSHPPSVSPFVTPTKTRNVKNIPLILLYTANIVLFLIFLVAIAWALAAGLMADRERRMWLQSGETARMASVLLQPEGGFWEKGWGPGAGGWGVGGDVEGLTEEGYF